MRSENSHTDSMSSTKRSIVSASAAGAEFREPRWS
jgi:hypothetical protein